MFHSTSPCFHSFIKMVVRIIRNKIKTVFIFMVLDFITIIGSIKETSTSKIKNIIKIIMYLVENKFFLKYFVSNPHSNELRFCFLVFLISFKYLNSIVIRTESPLEMIKLFFISFFFHFFNWKLNVWIVTL